MPRPVDQIAADAAGAAPRLPPSPREALIALAAAPTLGRPPFYRLAEELPLFLAGAAEGAPAALLAARLGLPPAPVETALAALPAAAAVARRELARAAKLGAAVVTRLDADYPPALLPLALAPPVLWLRGALPAGPALAVVGSRRADPYGKETAELLARELAAGGVAIVSGFARGIDAAAHRGALAAPGGRTVAVLGCGLDVDYPRGHRKLGEEVAARGALVSEFPCGWSALARHFPIRNRLIAALSAGTLVVEAAARSGSLVTARHALELGREVLAVPGRIFDEKALGPNSLLRDGAVLVRHPRDVLEALWPEMLAPRTRDAGAPDDAVPTSGRGVPPGPAGELLAALPPAVEVAPEEAAARARRPVAQALAELLELEIGGWVRRLPGPAYVRVP
jgi:DNA processing protein